MAKKRMGLLLIFDVLVTAMVVGMVLMGCGGKASAQSGGGGKANPATDFKYDLNAAGDGVVIQEVLVKDAKTIKIPEKIEGYPVVEIRNNAFWAYQANMSTKERGPLVSITIPDTVTVITESMFDRITSLESITLSQNLKELPETLFGGCVSLKTVVIPNSVTKIGRFAFSGCTALASVKIPSSVTMIGEGAFRRCKSLESITIPSGVTEIDDSTFKECESLKEVVLPDSVTRIGFDAFNACLELAKITLPKGPVEYSSSVFEVCPKLSLAARKSITDSGYAGSF